MFKQNNSLKALQFSAHIGIMVKKKLPIFVFITRQSTLDPNNGAADIIMNRTRPAVHDGHESPT